MPSIGWVWKKYDIACRDALEAGTCTRLAFLQPPEAAAVDSPFAFAVGVVDQSGAGQTAPPELCVVRIDTACPKGRLYGVDYCTPYHT